MMLTGFDMCACGHFRNAHHSVEGCCRTEWVRDVNDYTAEREVICPCQRYTPQTGATQHGSTTPWRCATYD